MNTSGNAAGGKHRTAAVIASIALQIACSDVDSARMDAGVVYVKTAMYCIVESKDA